VAAAVTIRRTATLMATTTMMKVDEDGVDEESVVRVEPTRRRDGSKVDNAVSLTATRTSALLTTITTKSKMKMMSVTNAIFFSVLCSD